jgi:hypothetical protein
MKMSTTAWTVLGYMFLLELGGLAAFANWGSRFNVYAAIFIPLAVFLLWSMYLAPKASRSPLPNRVRTIFKLVVFILSAAALYDGGHNLLATIFLVTSVIDVTIVILMKLDIRMAENA